MAFSLCSLLTIDGFVNFCLSLYSREIPVFSNFRLSFFKALSMLSPSFNGTMIINAITPLIWLKMRRKVTIFFNTTKFFFRKILMITENICQMSFIRLFLLKKVHLIRQVAFPAVILILTIFVYSGVRDFEFVNWDDQVQVVSNEDIAAADGLQLKKIFSSFYAGMYQPLTTLTFVADYAMYDGTISSGFHISSLVLHLLNIILLYLLLLRLGFTNMQTGILALIFALHPVQVEAVSWISARSTLLFTFFYLLALIRYASYAENRNTISVITAFLFYILALLSKPSAASFFLLIPVIEYWFYPKLTFRTFLRMLLFALPAAAILVVTYYSRSDTGTVLAFSDSTYTPFQNMSFAMWSVLLYAVDLFVPLTQQVVRLYPAFQFYMFLIPLFLFILFIIALLRLKKFRKVLLLSAGMFIIPLSVHLKIIPFGDILMADRYAYLSVAGIFILPLCIIFSVIEKLKGTLFNIACILLVLIITGIFGYQSYHRKETWKNSNALWSHVIMNNPEYYQGYYNRGIAIRDRGRHAEAIKDFTAAMTLRPDFAETYLARGAVYSAIGDFNKATADFDMVIRLQPEMHAAYLNRANAFYNSGDFISAVRDYKTFLKIDPMHEQASFFLILSMIRLDYDPSELLVALNEFVERFPGNPEGYYFRGLVMLQADGDKACNDFHAAAGMGNEEAKMFVMKYCL
jgi:protein O-mannosyl-transferase